MNLSKRITLSCLATVFFSLSVAEARSTSRWGRKKPSTESSRQTTTPSRNECGNMNANACETFLQINEVRESQGLQALDPYSTCANAAQEHAEAMYYDNFFDHNAPDESWSERMARYRLRGSAVGENIAMTGAGPDDAVNRWVRSPGHYKNIVGRKFRSSGVGYFKGYYVQCFSGRSTY